MKTSQELVSPKQVARAIGVSESSLKRWCDRGLIATVRTAGGHRKMTVSEVLRFIRQQNRTLSSPDILGLPPVSQRATANLQRSVPLLVEALLAGDESVTRQVLFDLYLAKHSLSVICDDVIAAAFREIGERWACHEADVYQERRGCEIILRVLFELRRMQPAADKNFLAIGGTVEGDFYSLPSTMVELVLAEAGFQASSLGTSIPFASLITAVQQIRPSLFWLSVSYIHEQLDFAAEFSRLSQACIAANTALVVGGRALEEPLRQRMVYSAYCDTMQHLEGFAKSLRHSQSAGRKHRERAKTPARPARKK